MFYLCTMGFNRRYVDIKSTKYALKNGKLKDFYGKADALFFQDDLSAEIYHMFCDGKSEEKILNYIKTNFENEKSLQKN